MKLNCPERKLDNLEGSLSAVSKPILQPMQMIAERFRTTDFLDEGKEQHAIWKRSSAAMTEHAESDCLYMSCIRKSDRSYLCSRAPSYFRLNQLIANGLMVSNR